MQDRRRKSTNSYVRINTAYIHPSNESILNADRQKKNKNPFFTNSGTRMRVPLDSAGNLISDKIYPCLNAYYTMGAEYAFCCFLQEV
jgi:hypothetical protein